MMNEPLNRPERNDSVNNAENDSADESTRAMEQQLRAMSPRAPQLDWQRIGQAANASPTPGDNFIATPAAGSSLITGLSTGQPGGFSTFQLACAVFGSWIIGAIVGGSAIFWSISRDSPSLGSSTGSSTHGSSTPDAPSVTQQTPVPSRIDRDMAAVQIGPGTTTESAVPAEQSNAYESRTTDVAMARTAVDVQHWIDQEPLSVRSHSMTGAAGLFTAIDRSPARPQEQLAPKHFTNQLSQTAPSGQIDSDWKPSPVSNRQNLLRQYLNEASQQIY